MFKKAYEEGKRLFVAFLKYRNTPISSIGLSPAQMPFNHRLKTKLLISNELLNTEIFQKIGNSLKQQQLKQKFYYDKTAKALRPLNLEENVQNFINKTWEPSKVIAKGL